MKEADEAITYGAGNVFADLGYPDAGERQTKLRLVHAIKKIIARRRLTYADVAEKLSSDRSLSLPNFAMRPIICPWAR